MKHILLIDFTRSFLDSRPAVVARSSKEALKQLQAYDGKLDEIWLDHKLGPADNAKPVLDYLSLRAKIGAKYKVGVIYVHSPEESSWQILNAKLTPLGYRVFRTSVRDTLGQL